MFLAAGKVCFSAHQGPSWLAAALTDSRRHFLSHHDHPVLLSVACVTMKRQLPMLLFDLGDKHLRCMVVISPELQALTKHVNQVEPSIFALCAMTVSEDLGILQAQLIIELFLDGRLPN